jgi:hypothetical protein
LHLLLLLELPPSSEFSPLASSPSLPSSMAPVPFRSSRSLMLVTHCALRFVQWHASYFFLLYYSIQSASIKCIV